MKKIFFLLVLLFPISLTTAFGQSALPLVEKLKAGITYLASDELEGRKSGTVGDSLAAIFIRERFAENGATLMGYNGFQYFGVISDVVAGSKNSLTVVNHDFVAGKDFMPFSFSSSETVDAEVVFAGFGISGVSGDLAWDDFAGKDVKNKLVLVLRGDPEPDNQNSAFIPMATDRAKALAAHDRGAAGILLVSPSSFDKKDQPVDITFDKTVSDAGLPVISITRNLAGAILGLPATAVDSLEKVMISARSTANVNGLNRVKLTADVIRNKVTTRNIIAMIPGNDPVLKDEFVVVGAHYDHLGMGGTGSGSRVPDVHAVHGGADDNASGVAAIIALSEYFAKEANRPSRSLLFVSFGAEEMGILGSRYFVANCPVAIKSVKAMVNLDMVGRLKSQDPALTISGTGTFTVADSLIDLLGKNRSFVIKKSPDGYGPSDHAAFYGKDIPVLFITTGAHEDYHTPDDMASRINYNGVEQVIDFTADLVAVLSDMPVAPVFREAGSRKESGNYGRNLKVTLGIMPDVSGAETSGGMKVEGTRKDGPAASAGMLKGDIITAINGMPVTNIYDYMSRLGKLKPGEVVNVEVIREGKKEVLIIQL
ncbi:MAG: M20/M25/M40 family metallo-hydrolase [Lentimicrobiaceae bacterium]|nr:M20/M25/M40 family metallo-hydrolase [Lentimicrobiaceae bacterium]MCB9023128.1 M20/M25/M40 family metallo-hydrolase [Lentimicrobiaceae bacterium]MCO5264653.1 M20/M25/M40 family metallo-hydrolase [Lentimicrobium sp.]